MTQSQPWLPFLLSTVRSSTQTNPQLPVAPVLLKHALVLDGQTNEEHRPLRFLAYSFFH